jgi:L-iditol 2-dehydrogenase
VSFEEATLIEPIACCIKALNKCDLRQGDTVVVIGVGPSGIMHTMLLKNMGTGKIIVSDFIEYRLKKAAQLGADIIINPQKEDFSKRIREETNNTGADLVIVTAPSIPAILSGFEVCSKGGTISIFAPTSPTDYLHLSPNTLFFSEIRVLSSYSTSHIETRTALKLITSKRIRAKELITHRYPLNMTGEAFKVATENKESLKIVIVNEKDNH